MVFTIVSEPRDSRRKTNFTFWRLAASPPTLTSRASTSRASRRHLRYSRSTTVRLPWDINDRPRLVSERPQQSESSLSLRTLTLTLTLNTWPGSPTLYNNTLALLYVLERNTSAKLRYKLPDNSI